MTTYVVGDVHGCFLSLMSLIDNIGFSPKEDKLVFVGDLINKGPDSLSVLRYVKSLGGRATVVLGNHDISLLAYAIGAYQKYSSDFEKILQASDASELLLWLRYQSILWQDESLGAVVVHAGINPRLSLSSAKQLAKFVEEKLRGSDYEKYVCYAYQKDGLLRKKKPLETKKFETFKDGISSFTRMRYCSLDGASDLLEQVNLKNSSINRLPWYKIRQKLQNDEDEQIFFGHWAALGLYKKQNYCCLDSGCAYGNALTAVALRDQKQSFISVPYAR